jgi:plastocyanin
MRIWPAVAIGALIVLGLWTLVVLGHPWSPARASTADTAVSMTQALTFSPDPITITTGTTVIWNNVTTNIPHTTTSNDGTSWDSGQVNAGGSFPFTFNTPGTFGYHCSFHGLLNNGVWTGMVGTIIVQSPSSTPTPTPMRVFLPSLFNNFGATPTSSQAVSMTDALRFVPDPITINVGTKVTWTNVSTGNTPHTTTSDTGLWDSGTVNPQGMFSFTFNTTGTFHYHCNFHQSSGMIGTITVQ